MSRLLIATFVLSSAWDFTAPVPSHAENPARPIPTRMCSLPTPPPVLYQVRRATIRLSRSQYNDAEKTKGSVDIYCPMDGPPGCSSWQLTFFVEQGSLVKRGDLLISFSTQAVGHVLHEAFIELQEASAAAARANSNYQYLSSREQRLLTDLELDKTIIWGNRISWKKDNTLQKRRDELTTDITMVEGEIQLMEKEQDSELKTHHLRQQKDRLADLQLRMELLQYELPFVGTWFDIEAARAERAHLQGKKQIEADLAILKASTEAAAQIEEKCKSRYVSLQDMLGRCRLYAPVDGVVMHHSRWLPGDLVSRGQKMLSLIAHDTSSASPLQSELLVVPNSAIEIDAGTSWCLVATEDTVERRALELGAANPSMTEVRRGLAEGDRVVLRPRRWPWDVAHKIMLPISPVHDSHKGDVVNDFDEHTVIVEVVPHGTLVQKGHVLIRLDTSDIRESLFRAEIAAARSQAAWRKAVEERNLQMTQGATDLRWAESELALAEAAQRAFGTKAEDGTFQARMKNVQNRIQIALKEERAASHRQVVEAELRPRRILREERDPEMPLNTAIAKGVIATGRLESVRGEFRSLVKLTDTLERLDLARSVKDSKDRIADVKLANQCTLAVAKSTVDSLEHIFVVRSERANYLRSQLAQAEIVSPCDGVVCLDQRTRVGASVAPKQILAVVESSTAETKTEALVIPVSAVLELNGSCFCQIWDSTNVELRHIEVGRRTRQWAEVLRGLSSGDMVTREPL